jgi:hypothetical protein
MDLTKEATGFVARLFGCSGAKKAFGDEMRKWIRLCASSTIASLPLPPRPWIEGGLDGICLDRDVNQEALGTISCSSGVILASTSSAIAEKDRRFIECCTSVTSSFQSFLVNLGPTMFLRASFMHVLSLFES